jgi:hypothetical protein
MARPWRTLLHVAHDGAHALSVVDERPCDGTADLTRDSCDGEHSRLLLKAALGRDARSLEERA